MTRLSGAQWRYCAKVGIATALGYLLTQGGQNQYAIYSAFTAALVVGTSVGEDLATSANRVKGTLAGMIGGMAVAALLGPNFLTIGISAALTGLLALALRLGHCRGANRGYGLHHHAGGATASMRCTTTSTGRSTRSSASSPASR
jgi:uncharacterized membrane protein YccC